MSSQTIKISNFSNEHLLKFGISQMGVVYEPSAITFNHYITWIKNGNAGYLNYLKDERANKRKSLLEVFPDFKSALVFLFPYKKNIEAINNLKIADYVLAFDELDYHRVLPLRIEEFFGTLNLPKNLKYQIAVDTMPVLERDLAYRAGLGWFGKNSMLLNKKLGSYFLIASAVFDVHIDLDTIQSDYETDHCGNCRACIDACPTNAIIENQRQIDVNKCIASYTIELFTDKKSPPVGSSDTNEIFGCDICQTVCPWNSKIEIKNSVESENSIIQKTFMVNSLEQVIATLESMSKRSFKKLFSHTSMGRTGRDSILKNLKDKL